MALPIRATDFALGVGVPLAGAIGCAVVALWYIAPGVDLDSMTRGIAGPGTWPKVMLWGAALCAALMVVRNLRSLLCGEARRADGAVPGEEAAAEEYDDLRLAIGIALIVGYGVAMGFIGMPLATMAFIAAWLVLGRLRRPVAVVLTSTIGTVAVLYLFVKVSQMPLDRGKGVFEQATIAIYRLLGIY